MNVAFPPADRAVVDRTIVPVQGGGAVISLHISGDEVPIPERFVGRLRVEPHALLTFVERACQPVALFDDREGVSHGLRLRQAPGSLDGWSTGRAQPGQRLRPYSWPQACPAHGRGASRPS